MSEEIIELHERLDELEGRVMALDVVFSLALYTLPADLRRLYSPTGDGVKDMKALIRERADENPAVIDLFQNLMVHEQTLAKGHRRRLGFTVRASMVQGALLQMESDIRAII